MSRIYTELDCGCLISCDRGGGLMPCFSDDCKAKEYFDEHDMINGYCKICHPEEYKKAKKEYENANS